jgi:uncharacterized protein involved in exopolysaccharide biosynthesis
MSINLDAGLGYDGLALSDLVRVVRSRGWIVLGVGAAAAVAALAYSLLLPPVYESVAVVQLSEDSAPAYATATGAAEVIRSRDFLATISRSSGAGPTADELLGRVWVEPVRDSKMIRIRVRSPGDPGRASQLGRVVTNGFVTRAASQVRAKRSVLERNLASIRTQLTAVLETLEMSRRTLAGLQRRAGDPPGATGLDRSFALNAIATAEELYASLTRAQDAVLEDLLLLEEPVVVQASFASTSPVTPRPWLTTVLAALGGLVLGAAAAYSADALRPSRPGPAPTSDLELPTS